MNPDDHVCNESSPHHSIGQCFSCSVFRSFLSLLPCEADVCQHRHTTERLLRYWGVNGLEMAPLINNRVGLGGPCFSIAKINFPKSITIFLITNLFISKLSRQFYHVCGWLNHNTFYFYRTVKQKPNQKFWKRYFLPSMFLVKNCYNKTF